jgi:DNA-binding NarL/FixJ family response regulator
MMPAVAITKRQYQVVQLLALGRNRREIADRLFVGRGTVHEHLHLLYGRMRDAGETGSATRAVWLLARGRFRVQG